MTLIILTTLLAAIIFIFEYINVIREKENKRQRLLTLSILLLSVITLIIENSNNFFSTIQTSEYNLRLENKSDSLIKINLNLNLKIDSLNYNNKNIVDSLYFANQILKEKLEFTQQSIEKLSEETQSGLEINRETINNLETFENQRFIPKAHRSHLINKLSLYKGDSIRISYYGGDQEAISFANDFRSIFKSAGWKIMGFGIAISMQPIHGVKIDFFKKDQPKIEDIFNTFYNLTGYKFNGYWHEKDSERTIELTVGLNEE